VALVLGTNCGFVTVAPTENPSGSGSYTIDAYQRSLKVTAPVGATTITEVGWYTSNATEESNFEVGLYADNAGAPAALLYSFTTNAKGTGAGWKVKTGLNWAITAGTVYHLAVQLDNTTTTTTIQSQSSVAGGVYYYRASVTALTDPMGGTAGSANEILAIYGIYTTGGTIMNPHFFMGANYA
jgi:hypothetical protein